MGGDYCMKTAKQIAAEYQSFIADTGGRCWRCGRTAQQRPRWWGAPFGIERAHICNKPRIEAREACISLCSLCHRIQHGDRFPQCQDRPLKIPELLAIKKWCDPEYWDRAFLQKCSIRRLPREATRKQVAKVAWKAVCF